MSPARAERTARNMSAPVEVPTADECTEGMIPGSCRATVEASARFRRRDVPTELDRSAERALLVHRLVVELDVDVRDRDGLHDLAAARCAGLGRGDHAFLQRDLHEVL